MSLNVGSFKPNVPDTRAAELANAQAAAGSQHQQRPVTAAPTADSPALSAHRGNSGFDRASPRSLVRLASSETDSAAAAIRPNQPGPGHNGGPPMPNSILTGPTLPSHTADPTRGTRDPINLGEQSAINQVRANPGAGREVIPANRIGDPRFAGYSKYEQTIRSNDGVNRTVHYMYNPQTGHATDLKIAGVPPTAPRDASQVQRTTSSDGRQYGVGRNGDFYRYDANGRFEARVPSVRDLPQDVRGRLGMRAMNIHMRRIGRTTGVRGND